MSWIGVASLVQLWILCAGISIDAASCGDHLELGQLLTCAKSSLLPSSMGDYSIQVSLRNGQLRTFVTPTLSTEYAKNVVYKVRCSSDTSFATFGRRKIRQTHAQGKAKVDAGVPGSVQQDVPQEKIQCSSTCCGQSITLQVSVKLCQRRLKCWNVERQRFTAIPSGLGCKRPCGLSPGNGVKLVLKPCPKCVCENNPEIAAPGGDPEPCSVVSTPAPMLCELQLEATKLSAVNAELFAELTGDATVAKEDPSVLLLTQDVPSGGSFELAFGLRTSSLPLGEEGGRFFIRMNKAVVLDGTMPLPRIVQIQLKPGSCDLVTNEEKDPSFDVQFLFTPGVPKLLKNACRGAAARLSQVVTKGFPPVTLVTESGATEVDDLLIEVRYERVSVGESLASAVGTGFREAADNSLAFFGVVRIDSADFEQAKTEGGDILARYTAILIHEFLHVLGFTFRQFVRAGLVNSQSDYDGRRGVREYNAYLQSTEANEDSVPLEGGDTPSHLDESVFGNELMTPILDSVPSPLSRISIGILQDLGYAVDYFQADPYSLTTTSIKCALRVEAVQPNPDAQVKIELEGDATGFAEGPDAASLETDVPIGSRFRLVFSIEGSSDRRNFTEDGEFAVFVNDTFVTDGTMPVTTKIEIRLKPNSCEPETESDSSYEVDFQFTSGTPSSLKSSFIAAGEKLSAIITSGQPSLSIVVGGTEIQVDDLFVDVRFEVIDGPGGITGSVALTGERGLSSRRLPFYGIITLDSEDYNAFENSGVDVVTLYADIARQVVIHTAGFARHFFMNADLLGSATQYVGTNGLREYNSYRGGGAETFVPLFETSTHWDHEVVGREQMTTQVLPPRSISRLTIGALEDLGYTVDYSQADDFSLPANDFGLPAPSSTNWDVEVAINVAT